MNNWITSPSRTHTLYPTQMICLIKQEDNKSSQSFTCGVARIDDLLDYMRIRVLLNIELRLGYHQVRIKDKDI